MQPIQVLPKLSAPYLRLLRPDLPDSSEVGEGILSFIFVLTVICHICFSTSGYITVIVRLNK
jgi:hypothetical protein